MRRVLGNKGFTLIELIVVVVILAILAMIAVPSIMGATDNAKISAVKANLDSVSSAINRYYTQNGVLPGDTSAVTGDSAGISTLLSGKTLTSMGITYFHQNNSSTTYTLSCAATAAPYNLVLAKITYASGATAGNFGSPFIVASSATTGGGASAVSNAAAVAAGATGSFVEMQSIQP